MKEEEKKTNEPKLTVSTGEPEEVAVQAETVAETIGSNPKNTIVLGDFNDTPLSYTHHLFDQKLNDCYAERGVLMGFSYVNHGMFVRIDHTFCSDDFETVKCYVDNSAAYSDHYPIITYLKRK